MGKHSKSSSLATAFVIGSMSFILVLAAISLVTAWKSDHLTGRPERASGNVSPEGGRDTLSVSERDNEIPDRPLPPSTLSIEKLGISAPVNQNVHDTDLASGVGHYPTSQVPGQKGNISLAGHRDGSYPVFMHLDQLNTCDEIKLTTRAQTLIFRVLPTDGDPEELFAGCMPGNSWNPDTAVVYAGIPGRAIVEPGAAAVVNPVPGQAVNSSLRPTTTLVTLTTCHPLYENRQRLIVHAALAETIEH